MTTTYAEPDEPSPRELAAKIARGPLRWTSETPNADDEPDEDDPRELAARIPRSALHAGSPAKAVDDDSDTVARSAFHRPALPPR